MKTVFITIGESFIARNIFRTPFWQKYTTENKDMRTILLVKKDRLEEYKTEFSAPGVLCVGIDPRFRSRYANVVTSLARSALNTGTNLWSKMRSYERGDSSFVATTFKRVHTRMLGGNTWYKKLLRNLILRIEPSREVRELFDTYQPDLVFATSLTNFDFDVPVACEARRRGVFIAGMVRSWDNFTSHGMLRVVPDFFILQNEYLKMGAEKYQRIDPKKVPMVVVGLPHYDPLVDFKKLLIPRSEFFKKNGLDPEKKLITYGAMGDFLFPHETDVVGVFERLVENGSLPNAQVVFRPHPKFISAIKDGVARRHVHLDESTVREDKVAKGGEMDMEDLQHFFNMLYHSDVVVTGASTIAIDAALLDKPTICIAFDTRPVSYWTSIKRFYDSYTHFEALVATGGVALARTEEEMVGQVHRYLEHAELDAAGRGQIVDLFVAPFDGRASIRVFEELQKVINTRV